MLKKYKQLALAMELLNRQARATIVQQVTGLPIKLIRKTYRELHGRSSGRGSLKFSTRGVTSSNLRFKEVTLFAVCFRAFDDKHLESHAHRVIAAFDIYKQSNPAGQLNFSDAWVIAQDLRDKTIQITKCPHCQSWVLLNAREDLSERCGVCKTNMELNW